MTDPKRRRLPKIAITIGILVGALLGALLAKGVLSIVYWRRDLHRQEQFDAELKAAEGAARRKTEEKAARDAEWRERSKAFRQP